MPGIPTTPTGAALTQDKDGGGEVSVKEFDRAMRAAEKLPSKKERQEWQTATVSGRLVDEEHTWGFHGKQTATVGGWLVDE